MRHAARINGLTSLILTKLDVLDSFEEIQLCVGYKRGEETVTHFPASLRVLGECEPVYETMPGWNCSTEEARSFEDLPQNAQNYIRRIEEICEVPVALISVGPSRESYVMLDESLLNYSFER